MQTIAQTLTPEEIDRLANYYGSQPAGPLPGTDAPDDVLAHGRRLALEGVPERDLQPCAGCHGTVAEYADAPYFPVLGGQYEEYLQYKLAAWRTVRHPDNVWNRMMSYQAHDLTDEDIAGVAAYYASTRAETVRETFLGLQGGDGGPAADASSSVDEAAAPGADDEGAAADEAAPPDPGREEG